VTLCKELKEETEKLKEEKEVMADDLAQWKKNFENLEAESRKLFEEMRRGRKKRRSD
jgi:prefoldin subunit 5